LNGLTVGAAWAGAAIVMGAAMTATDRNMERIGDLP
jgi:hypothetical protein